jgi:poly-gamma-glutamate synthesis protein (capsule biosynthesis protein)
VNKKIIAYSLGNFVSNQKQPNTDGGIFLEVELIKTKSAETIIADFSYTPVYRYRAEEGGKKNFYIIPVEFYLQNSSLLPKLNFKNRSKMISFAERMRKHLSQTSNCRERKFQQKSSKGMTSLFN